MKRYEAGMKVIVNQTYNDYSYRNRAICNKVATVLGMREPNIVTVEFEEEINGHAGDCKDYRTGKTCRGKEKHCWNLRIEHVEPVSMEIEEITAMYINKKISESTYLSMRGNIE